MRPGMRAAAKSLTIETPTTGPRTTSITLGGKEAKLEDLKKGQQAQVEYVERNERNRARSVRLFESGGDSQGGEKTG